MARKTSEETTLITPAQADAAEVHVPSARKTGPSSWARGVSRIKSGAFFEGRKNKFEGDVDPTAGDDQTQGYGIGSIFLRTTGLVGAWFAGAVPTGAAIWNRIVLWTDLHPVALNGAYNDLEGLPGLGSASQYNDTRYAKNGELPVEVVNCNGDPNTPRPPQYLLSQVVVWTGLDAGEIPAFMGPNDLFLGQPGSVENYNLQEGTTYTPSILDIYGERPLWANNTSAMTVTLPANADVSAPVGWKWPVLRLNTGDVILRAIAPVTINGVSGRFKITNQGDEVVVRKIGPNSYRTFGAVEQLANLSVVTYPAGNELTTITEGGVDYYLLKILGSETSGTTITGEIGISGADLPVWRLYQAAGASAGRTRTSGASGGQTDEDETDLLEIGAIAFSLGGPGAGVTTASTDGSNGGDLVVNGVTYQGGRRGVSNNVNTPKPGIAGFNGSGAAYQTNASSDVGLGGATTGGGFEGGNSAGSASGLRASGGGGGSGGAGGDGNNTTGKGGKGGDGRFSLIEGGAGKYYGAGGCGDGEVSAGDPGLGVDDYGAGSGARSDPTLNAGNTRPGRRAAIIYRFRVSDCASAPSAV
jgi:hypothetical protein